MICRLLVAWGLCLLLPHQAFAELPQPLLWSVFPPGGRQATNVEVTVNGVDLDDAAGLRFEHPGITSQPVRPQPSELIPNPEPIPNRFLVTIDRAVPPGIYEVVCESRFGVSNPRLFVVGTTTELSGPPTATTAESPLELPLPATISGRLQAGQIDHFSIDCVGGSQLHIELMAERLDSRLTPVISLLGPAGEPLATAGELPSGDPSVSLKVPVTGRYQIQVRDLFMGGGSDWFYRLTVSPTPIIRSVWPPLSHQATAAEYFATHQFAGQPPIQQPLQATVTDRPRSSWRQFRRLLSPHDSIGDFVDITGTHLGSQPTPVPVLFSSSAAEILVADHPANTANHAVTLPNLPIQVVGRWAAGTNQHRYQFEAAAGETWVFDLYSHRLGCLTDPVLQLESITVSDAGEQTFKEVGFADDRPKAFAGKSIDGNGLDPTLSFKVPVTGRYQLTVANLDGGDCPRNDYVVDIRRPHPDFDLLAFLATVDRTDVNNKMRLATPSLVRGGTTAIDLLLLRHDGFAGPVVVTAEQLPDGVTARPLVIPAQANRGTLVLEASADATVSCRPVQLVGRARIGSEPRLRVARGITLSWPVTSNKQKHLVREVATVHAAVTPDIAAITIQPESPLVTIKAGSAESLPLTVTRTPDSKGPLSLNAVGLPKLLKVDTVTLDEKATTGSLKITVDSKLPPGDYAVVLGGVSKRMFRRNPEAADRATVERDRLKARVADLTTAHKQSQEAAEQASPEVAAKLKAANEALAKAEEHLKKQQQATAAKQIEVPLSLSPITVRVVSQQKPENP